MKDRHSLVGKSEYTVLKRAFQFDVLIKSGMERHHKFMDIGSGSLRNSETLRYLNEGCYHGIEVREDIFLEGLKEFHEQGLEAKEPDLRLFSDFRELDYPVNSFDRMLAYSVLIHMDDDTAKSCLAFVARYLSENGLFFANVNVADEPDAEWSGFPVVFRSEQFYNDLCADNGLDCVSLGPVSRLGHESGNKLGDAQIMLLMRHKH